MADDTDAESPSKQCGGHETLVAAGEDTRRVEEFLSVNGLGQYAEHFISNGFTEVADVLSVTNETLKEMGVEKVGTRIKILRLISAAKSVDPTDAADAAKFTAQTKMEDLEKKREACESALRILRSYPAKIQAQIDEVKHLIKERADHMTQVIQDRSAALHLELTTFLQRQQAEVGDRVASAEAVLATIASAIARGKVMVSTANTSEVLKVKEDVLALMTGVPDISSFPDEEFDGLVVFDGKDDLSLGTLTFKDLPLPSGVPPPPPSTIPPALSPRSSSASPTLHTASTITEFKIRSVAINGYFCITRVAVFGEDGQEILPVYWERTDPDGKEAEVSTGLIDLLEQMRREGKVLKDTPRYTYNLETSTQEEKLGDRRTFKLKRYSVALTASSVAFGRDVSHALKQADQLALWECPECNSPVKKLPLDVPEKYCARRDVYKLEDDSGIPVHTLPEEDTIMITQKKRRNEDRTCKFNINGCEVDLDNMTYFNPETKTRNRLLFIEGCEGSKGLSSTDIVYGCETCGVMYCDACHAWGSQMWSALSTQKGEWLRYEMPKPRRVARIEVTFQPPFRPVKLGSNVPQLLRLETSRKVKRCGVRQAEPVQVMEATPSDNRVVFTLTRALESPGGAC
eukprot:Sspe_Gene.65668::Locus_38845_Transcript_1_1_Confidence_1.000_Length_1963::g.65668::m.65668